MSPVFGANVFGAKKNKRVPNWTPLVDVIFLLLIFFMVTSSLSHPSAQPLAATVHGSGQQPIPLLVVRRDGSFVLKGEEMSESQLRLALQPASFASGVTVAVEEGITIGRMVRVTDWLRRARIAPLFFAAKP